jgi:type IV secretory pathway VirB10-like protein
MVGKVKDVFLKEPLPFTDKRDLNWSVIKKSGILSLIGLVFALLLMPEPKAKSTDFSEERPQTIAEKESEIDKINNDTYNLISGGNNFDSKSKLSGLYKKEPSPSNHKHASSMVIARNDLNSGNTLPMSSKIQFSLPTALKVEGSQMPVMAIVTNDVYYKESLAIPKNSSLFGHASFGENERVTINWKLVQFADGSEKKIQAGTVGLDGRMGVPGNLKGNSTANVAGQTISNVIAAYAQGSMQTGPLGANRGGHENGMRNAVSVTAKDRSEAWAEDLQKQVRWIEVDAGTSAFALVTQPFVFRDPGATYGQ